MDIYITDNWIGMDRFYLYANYGGHSTISPDDCLTNKWHLNLFFINGTVVHKSEFIVEPLITVPLNLPSSSAGLFSRIFSIKLFQMVHALKTKLFLDIS